MGEASEVEEGARIVPAVNQVCRECSDEIFYEMDDLQAEVYFAKNPHVPRDVDFVTLPPMLCDECEHRRNAIMLRAGKGQQACMQ